MKYLRSKRKGCKIKLSPNVEIMVMMYDVVRVDDNYDVKGRLTDGYVTILSMTGKEMLYQNKPNIWTKRRYLVKLLEDTKRFRITEDFNFIDLKTA